MNEPIPANSEITPADSFLTRAGEVFISPGVAFESIVRRPDFLAPLLAAIVTAFAVTEIMLQKIGMERLVRQAFEVSGRASTMSADQVDRAVQQGVAVGGILARVAAFIGPPLYLLIIAAVGFFIVTTIFGATADFKACFAVICYANLVSIVGAALAVVVILFGDVEQFNPQNFIPSNVGFFLDPRETAKWLYTIASSFDIFTIWLLVLASLGLSTASARKVRPVSIFLTYLGMWIFWVLVKAGWVTLMR
jgi:hypothetical protein